MALGTGHGGAHPNGHGGIDAVDNGGIAELLIVGSALAVGHGIPVEGGSHQLILTGIGQEVSGDLFDGELVKRFVGVERFYNVITESPDGARRIVGIACGVSITREIQPAAGLVLAVGRGCEEAVGEAVIGIRRNIADKGVHLIRTRGKPGQIEGETAGEGGAIRFRLGLEAFVSQSVPDEGIDRVKAGNG